MNDVMLSLIYTDLWRLSSWQPGFISSFGPQLVNSRAGSWFHIWISLSLCSSRKEVPRDQLEFKLDWTRVSRQFLLKRSPEILALPTNRGGDTTAYKDSSIAVPYPQKRRVLFARESPKLVPKVEERKKERTCNWVNPFRAIAIYYYSEANMSRWTYPETFTMDNTSGGHLLLKAYNVAALVPSNIPTHTTHAYLSPPIPLAAPPSSFPRNQDFPSSEETD